MVQEITMVNGESVGSRIYRLRTQAGLTQGQLAEYAHVGRSWLSLLETNKIANVGGYRLDRLARFFDVSSHYLLTGVTSDEDDTGTRTQRSIQQIRLLMQEIERLLRTVSLDPASPDQESDDHTSNEHDGIAGPNDPEPDLEGPASG